MHTFICCFYLFFSVTTIPDPEFVDEIGNITVPAGRNVKLACSVKDLGSFKVRESISRRYPSSYYDHVYMRNSRRFRSLIYNRRFQ